VRHNEELTGQADLLAQLPAKGVAVSGVCALILDIRGRPPFVPAIESIRGVSTCGDSSFSDTQKEVVND